MKFIIYVYVYKRNMLENGKVPGNYVIVAELLKKEKNP